MVLLIGKDFGKLASIFSSGPIDTALSDGIVGGFAVVGYRGKTWSLRQGGQETILMRDDGDGARNSIDVVVVAASHVIAKTWYEAQYTEGSNQPPDCFSNNGVAPDPTSTKKQNNLCGTCPHNVIGSVITPAGKKAKACHDRKRMAVVPAGDLLNEGWGGPMLLVSPPTSLGALLQFEMSMRNQGFPYYSYVTRFAFDPEEAYPRFVLSPVRALSEEEAAIITDLRADPRTERIIAETNSFDDTIQEIAGAPAGNGAPAVPQPVVPQQPAASSPPAPTTAAPAAAPPPPKRRKAAAAAAPPPAAAPAPTPAPTPATQTARSTAGFGASPAPVKAAAAQEPPEPEQEEIEDATVVEDNNDKLDSMLDTLLPRGNA
jgi:hypothetical protein